jgi:SWI/SNF-related matrix-associated actin-dependent regulator of chromatin subfamily A3
MINEWFQELKKCVTYCISSIFTNLTRHFGSATLSALTTIKYHGLGRERSSAVLCSADIVITTYHTLAAEIEWYRLVLDEGT